MDTILLASQSPRRREILQQIGIPFTVEPALIAETFDRKDPLSAPQQLAEQKALAVSARFPHRWVLGYDTLVFLDQNPLGKPQNTDEARKMLQMLRNRTHQVITGICLSQNNQIIHSSQETTQVTFRNYRNHEIDDYIASEEPMDKAGAYGIQGRGARLVQKIDGCYYNVVGLPVNKTLGILDSFVEKN